MGDLLKGLLKFLAMLFFGTLIVGGSVVVIHSFITKKKLTEEMAKRKMKKAVATYVKGYTNRVKLTDLQDKSKSFTMEGTGIDDVRDGEILIA